MCLGYTGFRGELEHIKIEVRLIDESFECVMGCLEPTFYYEQQVKGELKRIHISGYRCNERLKAKTELLHCLL